MTDSLRARALRMLARREHSRAELAGKLGGHATEQEISDLLERLEATGLLSDSRAAQSFVRLRANRFGAARLRRELAQRGIDADTAADALAAVLGDEAPDELSRAADIWRRKFGSAPADAREYARQARFLQGRGFSADIVHKVLKESAE